MSDNFDGMIDLIPWQKEIMEENLKKEYKIMTNDPVNHPSHYTDGNIEVIDFIEDKQLGFHLGNAVKYISRAGKKDPEKKIEDLKKARWYLDREINRLDREARTIHVPPQAYPPLEDARIGYAQEHTGDLE